ncbi:MULTISPECIES: DUF4007 family protein [Exiguobacterium]|uniref:DUF4007 domain-containing protein n=1 Tax=Exiguobacterium indicum TaxID=296995 RepID=A0A0V8GEX9_9BACL|nr:MULTISPECIES: DUF4007 family protein [Exiguobacterium]KSU48830.1 hypothetical protein AS033_10905 [Exiguobacterium enclense]SDC86878.1 Protein of unknown function [Exiguobacterium enclense]
MGFGQHQSFYLRPQWLYKGLTEIKSDARFFYNDTHFEQLGLGKNMAKSAKYWLFSTGLMEEKRQSGKTEHHLTSLGELVDKYDKYIQHPVTKSILHYILASDPKIATSWYWFFNVFKESIFDKAILIETLEIWIGHTLEKSVSSNSLKRDIDCLIQMYGPNNLSSTPEDVIKSPFEELGLVSNTVKGTYKKTPLDTVFKFEVLFITFLIYIERNELTEVSLDELIDGENLWGRIFNLSRSEIVNCLEEMQKRYPIIFTRTNRLDVVRITDTTNYLDYMERFFENEVVL